MIDFFFVKVFFLCRRFSRWKRKGSPVATSPLIQWAPSLCSLTSHVLLCRLFFTARPCSLSLYMARICLCFISLTVKRYSVSTRSLFTAWQQCNPDWVGVWLSQCSTYTLLICWVIWLTLIRPWWAVLIRDCYVKSSSISHWIPITIPATDANLNKSSKKETKKSRHILTNDEILHCSALLVFFVFVFFTT